MVSETALQRTFLAVGSIGRWEYLLHFSCFLIYSDLMLVLGRGVSIGEINLEWLKTNTSLGVVLVLLVGYAFTKSFMLPVVDILYSLCVVFPVCLMRMERLPQGEIGIRSWWAYAMLTRNTPAYREAERLRAKNEAREESSAESRHLGLLLIADWLIGRNAGKSLVHDLFAFVSSLQVGQRYLFLIPLLLFFATLGFNALLGPLAARLSISVDNKALLREVKELIAPREGDVKQSLHAYPTERLQLYLRILSAGRNLGQAASRLFSDLISGERCSADQVRNAQDKLSKECRHFGAIADETSLISSAAVQKAVAQLGTPLLMLAMERSPEKVVQSFEKTSDLFYDRLREFVAQARYELLGEPAEAPSEGNILGGGSTVKPL